MLRPKVLACCVLRYTRRPVMSFDRTADRRAVELADVLDDLGRPDAVTLSDVTNRAAILHLAFAGWLRDRRNRRSIPHPSRIAATSRFRTRTTAPEDRWHPPHDLRQGVAKRRSIFCAGRSLMRRSRPIRKPQFVSNAELEQHPTPNRGRTESHERAMN